MRESMMLLLSDNRGTYIPRDFVTEFDLSRFDGIKAGDAMICANPDHEHYWDAWQAILDEATFTHGGHVYRLHQDGDLWAICSELMTNEEYSQFFGEMKPAPDDAYEYEACGDCLMILANDDASGMDDATESAVRAGLSDLYARYRMVNADGAEYGFRHRDCEVCGALPGDRYRIICMEKKGG